MIAKLGHRVLSIAKQILNKLGANKEGIYPPPPFIMTMEVFRINYWNPYIETLPREELDRIKLSYLQTIFI